MDYSWEMYLAWFGGQSLAAQIISIVAIVALTVAIITLVVEIIKAVFWLTFQLLRVVFFGVTILMYSLITIFLLAPIELILQNKRISTIWDEYAENVNKIFKGFFGIDGEKAEEKEEIKEAPAQEQPTVAYAAPQDQKPAYHCSNCGASFTEQMGVIITSDRPTYCAHCGQGYHIENTIPVPIYIQ